MQDEKRKALENVFGQIEKQFGAGAVMRLGEKTDAEVEAMNIETKRVEMLVKVGDNVVVNSGLFEGYTGTVQSVSEDLKKITVLIKRGRRDMPVELDADVVKLA